MDACQVALAVVSESKGTLKLCVNTCTLDVIDDLRPNDPQVFNLHAHDPYTIIHQHTHIHTHTQVAYICIKTMSVPCVPKTIFLLHKFFMSICSPPLPTSFLYIHDMLLI